MLKWILFMATNFVLSLVCGVGAALVTHYIVHTIL